MEEVNILRCSGNAAYKEEKLTIALEVYMKALSLAPEDPKILSNISATKFELGDYEGCLDILCDASKWEGEAPSKRRQLLLRKVKCFFYLRRFDKCLEELQKLLEDEDVEAGLKVQGEAIQKFLDAEAKLKVERPEVTSDLESNFPFYRQAFFNDDIEYFINGNDFSKSIFTKQDLQMFHNGTMPKELSFFFGGVGDARSFYTTLFDLAGMKNQLEEKDTMLKFTLVDIKAEVMARNLIILKCMHEVLLLTPAKGEEKELKRLMYLSLIFYVYSASVMPPMIYEKLRKVMEDFNAAESAADRSRFLPWVDIDDNTRGKIKNVFADWLDKADKTMDMKREHIRFKPDKSPDPQVQLRRHFMTSEFPLLRKEIELFPKCHATIPSWDLLKLEPELKKLFFVRVNDASKISEYVFENWKENVTWRDVPTEERYDTRRGQATLPLDDPLYHLNHLINRDYDQIPGVPSDGHTLMTCVDIANAFFSTCIESIPLLGSKIIFRVGDANAMLLSMPERSLDSIHLSNVPEYTGGYLTLTLCAATRLKPTAYVQSNIMRYTFAFDNFDHIISDSLLVSSAKHAEQIYGITLSKRNKSVPKSGPDALKTTSKDIKSLIGGLQVNDTAGSVGFPTGLGAEDAGTDIENMATLGEYLAWSLNEPDYIMTKRMVRHLLHWLFFKIVLPPLQDFEKLVVHNPLSLVVFLRAVEFFVENRKVPAHSVATILEGLLGGTIDTTARPPPPLVLRQKLFGFGIPVDPQSKTPHPITKLSTIPFVPELEAALVSNNTIKLPVLTTILPTDITPYEVQFKLFVRYDSLEWNRNLALVFFRPEYTRSFMRTSGLRSILDSGPAEKQNAIVIYSSFRLIATEENQTQTKDPGAFGLVSEEHRLTRTAKFSMSKKRMEDMKKEGWMVGIWRIDSWCPQDKFSFESVGKVCEEEMAQRRD